MNTSYIQQDLILAFLKCFFVTIVDFMTRIVQSQSPGALLGSKENAQKYTNKFTLMVLHISRYKRYKLVLKFLLSQMF